MELYTFSEENILKKISESKNYFYLLLDFLFFTAFPFHNLYTTGHFYFRFNTNRKDLGLEPNKKPGDIDVIIIPKKNNSPLFEKIIVAEVKIVRPHIKNPQRNVNTYGVSQVKGLIEAGFPYVGLIHISVPEKLPKELHIEYPLLSKIPKNREELKKAKEFIKLDPLPILSAEKQYSRLNKLNIPNYIGFHSFSLSTNDDGITINSCSTGYSRMGKLNPFYNKKVIDLIEENFTKLNYQQVDLGA